MAWGFPSKIGLGICLSASLTLAGGLCHKEAGSNGLARDVCFLPYCPSGGDCFPPKVDGSLTQVDYEEPRLQWQDTCPDSSITGSCWEVVIRTRIRLTASGPSGVAAVGVYIKQLVDSQELITKLWSDDNIGDPPEQSNATPRQAPPPTFPIPSPIPTLSPPPPPPIATPRKDAPVTLEMVKDVIARVPPGQRLEVWVSDLCARDEHSNSGCIPSERVVLASPQG